MSNRIKEACLCDKCNRIVGLILVNGVKKYRLHSGPDKKYSCWNSLVPIEILTTREDEDAQHYNDTTLNQQREVEK